MAEKNVIFDDEHTKDLSNKSEESKKDTFESWIVDLEEAEQPNACSIDNPDCENCGS
tara:strand:+ start:205 stop:375 length:171 start_codon:yes stop_codon:yes gene_type:complete